TGRMYIGDVGGNDPATAKEELNLGQAGANYDWPNSEGTCSRTCVSPLYWYAHNGRDAAITAGFVYHGTQFPSQYQGSFFFAGYADPEGQTLSYNWTFGDGTTSTLANPTHTYPVAGPYTVRLSVSDGVNTTVSTPLTISVGTAPTATILAPTDGATFVAGDVI